MSLLLSFLIGKAHCHKMPGFYQCGSGDCVPTSKVCDLKTDCEDGSDEGMACGETNLFGVRLAFRLEKIGNRFLTN